MRYRLILIGGLALFECLGHWAQAGDEMAPQFQTPVGIGTSAGDVAGHADYGFILEAQNHFKQVPDQYKLNRYGQAESRCSLGDGVGFSLSAMSGITLYGLNPDRPENAPQIGIEPFSGAITWNSNGHQNNYYEWLPMVSAGIQWKSGSCKILPLLRGGGAVGTITNRQWAWMPTLGTAYGAGGYLNCESLDIGADATRVFSQNRGVNLQVVDTSYRFSRGGIKIGVRGEHEIVQQDHSETRVLLVFRAKIVD